VLPTENFLIGVDKQMETIQFLWLRLLLLHLKHRAIGCILTALSGFWIIYLLANFICPGFWCAPLIITILTPVVAILIWTAIISDTQEKYDNKLKEIEDRYKALLQLEENK